MTSQELRQLQMQITAEQVVIVSEESTDPEYLADKVLSFVAFMVYTVTEAELRYLFRLAGLDLDDYDVFCVVQDFTSWYVGSETIELIDRMGTTLVDLETSLITRHRMNEEMQERMSGIKFDGAVNRLNAELA